MVVAVICRWAQKPTLLDFYFIFFWVWLGARNFLGLVGYEFAEYVGKFGFKWWFLLMVVVGSQNFGVILHGFLVGRNTMVVEFWLLVNGDKTVFFFFFHFHVLGKTMIVLA